MTSPRILVATDGPPMARWTWSGSSRGLCHALARAGMLAGAINVKPRWVDLADKAGAAWPGRPRWRQRYRSGSSLASPAVRGVMCAVGARRAAAVQPPADVILQISGWYDVTRCRGPRPRLHVSYQDANVALWLGRPDLAVPRGAAGIRRSMAAERRVYDRLDLILTMSEWARRSFIADYGQAPEKVVSIGAGANLGHVPEHLPPRLGPARVLFVGRTFERKGGPQLLAAFRVLREHHPDAELTIVGPAPRDAEPGVHWLGPIYRDTPESAHRLDQLFRDATIFALPSLYEGFGIPLLEAMAYGLPVVAADVCAIPEIVLDGQTGRLVPPADVETLATALIELAGDPVRAADFGTAGRERFHAAFGWDEVAARLAETLQARLSDR